jgi:type IV secretory pathway VirB6-like protein
MIRFDLFVDAHAPIPSAAFCTKFQKALDDFVVKYLKNTHFKDFKTIFAVCIPGVSFPLCKIAGGKASKKAPLSTRRKKQLKARANRSAPSQLKKATKKVARKKNSSHSNYLKQKRDKFGRFIPKKVTKKKCRCRCRCKRSR